MKANDAILKNMQTNMTSLTKSNLELKNMFGQFIKMNNASSSGSRTLPGNTITNPKEDLKGITTRSGTAYQGPTIPTTTSSSPIVERKTEATKDTVHSTNNESTDDVQPLVVPTESPILNFEPVVSIIEPDASPVSAPRPNHRDSIPYPSRLQDQKLRDKANDQRAKFFQIFKDLNFNISFADALILMPKFGPSIKSLLTNKDKLCELARTLLNEHCLAVLLKKFPEKLGDPDKFLIPCDFPEMAECLALADLSASINLMPLRSFFKTEKALIDVFEGELTLHVGKEAITFNLDQTSRYSSNYNDMTANRIDVIDMHCEEYSQEFLGDDKLPVIIAKDLSVEEKTALIMEDFKPTVQHQRRVNPKIHDVIKNEVLKLLDAGLIYLISDSPWVSPVHCVPKKGGFTVVENEENELIPTRLVTGWHVCIDYRKFNEATRKDHFPLPFMDQMLERLAGNQYYCFLDGFSSCFYILIDLKDQEKTTFTCPYGTFAYHRMPFGLCNAPGTFQRNSFQTCLSHLEKMLKQCEDTNLCLNWEKSQFMAKEGIVLGHKILKEGIEVDKSKVDVITKLPHPTTVKGIRSFLGYAGFYRRFIQDFSKIARPMTRLLEKDTPFFFSKECVEAFQTLKRKLTEASILIPPDWDMPFELMCDASDFAIGAVLRQRQEKYFRTIHYASKTMTDA
nr:reverse transcriptase domain-containing protein [Tanacetum cinerariifolium]